MVSNLEQDPTQKLTGAPEEPMLPAAEEPEKTPEASPEVKEETEAPAAETPIKVDSSSPLEYKEKSTFTGSAESEEDTPEPAAGAKDSAESKEVKKPGFFSGIISKLFGKKEGEEK